jgi:hypothetical protein
MSSPRDTPGVLIPVLLALTLVTTPRKRASLER